MTEEASESTTGSTTATFDAEVERTPAWAHAASAGVIVASALVAAHIVEMFVTLPLLVLSSLGRRFGTRAVRVQVRAEGIDIDGRTIARQSIVDVWFDDDEVDPRVVLAFGDEDVEVVALRFSDRASARELAGTLAAKTDGSKAVVAGSRPRFVDLLASLRFVAIAGAFFATGSRIGLLILVFFVFGVWSFFRTTQVVLREEQLVVRRALATKTHAARTVASVDDDQGAVELKDGTRIDLSRGALRDEAMAPAPWLARARSRLFDTLRSRAPSK